MPNELSVANPWERQPGENVDEYILFTRYRDMGGMAGFQDLISVAGQPTEYVMELSRRWRWDDRVKAYRRTMEVLLSEHYNTYIKGTQKELVGLVGEALKMRLGKIFRAIAVEEGDPDLKDLLRDTKDLSTILEKITSKVAKEGVVRDNKPINIVFMPATNTIEIEAFDDSSV